MISYQSWIKSLRKELLDSYRRFFWECILHGFPSHLQASSGTLLSCILSIRGITCLLGGLLKIKDARGNILKETEVLQEILDSVKTIKCDRILEIFHRSREAIYHSLSVGTEGSDFSHLFQMKQMEHVLYDNLGVRRKVFYPNQQNPILCPVKILEEEKAMHPSDASCPSCLFLRIKYGGRTRSLPQNEYVRQRMGRNKLKALGITLLFMAGFPDDLLQRETKYRNLDLLQKYYRTNEDAEGEELFLSHPVTCDTVSPDSQQSTSKGTIQIMEPLLFQIKGYLQTKLEVGPALLDVHCTLKSTNKLLASFMHEKVYVRTEDSHEGAFQNELC
ncbi:hypothetical protein AAG906_040526 [Vitis piasezkii]